MNQPWLIYALGSAFFAGLTAILGKVGVQGVSSNLATLIRTIVIFAVTALLISARSEWKSEGLTKRTVLFLILSGIATGLSWLCYYRALQLGPASKVAPIDKLSVVFVLLFAVTFLGERMTTSTLVGATLIALGSVVLVLG